MSEQHNGKEKKGSKEAKVFKEKESLVLLLFSRKKRLRKGVFSFVLKVVYHEPVEW